jgi:catechol 2,3-dioxygenase-like lactoylglutathione lyase family enzyme
MSLLINVDVSDLKDAQRFYTEALGLRPGRRLGDAQEMLGAEVPIYLLQREEGSEPFPHAPNVRTFGPHWTPVHLDFSVPDIKAATRTAEAAGARREGHITEHSWGKLALMRDPFGNGFCLIEFSPEGYDAPG